MSDLIDRQKALEEIYQLPIIDRDAYEFYRDVRESIKSMPSAEPKKGKWIKNDNGTFSCSVCQSWIPEEQHYYARYCLYCGAKMGVME